MINEFNVKRKNFFDFVNSLIVWVYQTLFKMFKKAIIESWKEKFTTRRYEIKEIDYYFNHQRFNELFTKNKGKKLIGDLEQELAD